MRIISCAEIVRKNLIKIYEARFVELEELNPDLVPAERGDLYFRLCTVAFEAGVSPEAEVRLIGGFQGVYRLEVSGEGDYVLPSVITFLPDIYYVRGRLWTLEEALEHEDADRVARWMQARDATEAIQSINGHLHVKTPHVHIAELPVPA